MGSRTELYGVDGEEIFGGFDAARVYSSFTWFPMGKRFPGIDCPLQVELEDVVLNNSNDSQSLVPGPSYKIHACIDTIQNANTFPTVIFERWSLLTNRSI